MRTVVRCVGLWAAAIIAACSSDGVTSGRVLDAEAVAVSTTEVDAASIGEVQLEGINGRVTILGEEAAAVVSVRAERRVRSDSRADAERFLDQVRAEVSENDGTLSVRTVQPQDTDGREVIIHYRVTLPDDLSVLVANVNGEVRVQDVAGDVVAATVNGAIECELNPSPGGRVALTTVNGSVALGVPAAVSAMLEADVVNGTITVTGLTLLDASTSARSVRGRLGDGDGLIDLGTTNGSISVQGR
ncbi:MAG: hypothetical protein AMS19_06215 [Gemmatimonas sp. SG8_23]|nr:MAG: hypothetical protein AMS19_06215 [Gemmatimonas sp. SG8_23]